MSERVGTLQWISEFVVRAHLTGSLTISELVWVGEDRLTAEVIALAPEEATIQVYEDTTGLRPGAPLFRSGAPFAVNLGPGLLGNVFDGIQRPLKVLRENTGIFIRRGTRADSLDRERRWPFTPRANRGDSVQAGDLLGVVPETPLIEHRILVPPQVHGELTELAEEGEYTVADTVAVIRNQNGDERPLSMSQRWRVRRPRPNRRRLQPDLPLITGQRIIDTFFPVAKGGTAAVPGGFGTGKTVLQHALSRLSDADIIIHIGCGERGNEMTQVLEEFPKLNDPWSGHPLMERTILIANTSDMPVSARESSIYTGVTMAEYYRDQGYDVALLADSTSRWAQAVREISSRLKEMPVEEGYPAYLAARLSAFYERAGRVETLGGDNGSVTIIGAVSPPGGDFSEPVTRHTQRFTACWWALDRDLAHQRHYPAIDWLTSYSLQLEPISRWWEEKVDPGWKELRRRAIAVLQGESSLQQLVQLVGPDSLSAEQQWVLTGARLLREGFLQQNALHEIDAYAVPEKQVALLRLFLSIYEEGRRQLEAGASLESIRDTFELGELLRLRMDVANDELERLEEMRDRILDALREVQNGRKPSDPEDKTAEPGENRQSATAEKHKPGNESAAEGAPSDNRRTQPATSSQTAPGKENA